MNRFAGAILPELRRLVEHETITIIDGMFVSMDAAGVKTYLEFDELAANADVAPVTQLLDRTEDLISDEDVKELSTGLQPNSSAAIRAVEYTGMNPLPTSIVDADGVLVETIRVPATAVEEVLAAISQLD